MKTYNMFTDEGAEMVDSLVMGVTDLRMSSTDREIEGYLRKGMSQIENEHPEVWDRAVIVEIVNAVQDRTRRNMNLFNGVLNGGYY
jgi:hypothetical protein